MAPDALEHFPVLTRLPAKTWFGGGGGVRRCAGAERRASWDARGRAEEEKEGGFSCFIARWIDLMIDE